MERHSKFQQMKRLRFQIERAKRKLSSKDYVGRKIAEVLLMGTEQDVENIKKEYKSIIEEAAVLRAEINKWEEELNTLKLTIRNEK